MAGGRFYYFNGFNSAIPADWSENPKIAGVAEYALGRDFEFLPTSIDFRRADSRCREIVSSIRGDEPRVVFCGSSMGGWFARIVQLRLARERPGQFIDAVAFNPAFSLDRHGDLLVGPQENFVTGEIYQWTPADSKRLACLEGSVDYDAPLPFFVYVDRGDEVIAWEQSAARHAGMARFHVFEGGCHSFDHYREALQDYGARSAG
jgi:predicted esterase YcpF (UPF0227 family)